MVPKPVVIMLVRASFRYLRLFSLLPEDDFVLAIIIGALALRPEALLAEASLWNRAFGGVLHHAAFQVMGLPILRH